MSKSTKLPSSAYTSKYNAQLIPFGNLHREIADFYSIILWKIAILVPECSQMTIFIRYMQGNEIVIQVTGDVPRQWYLFIVCGTFAICGTFAVFVSCYAENCYGVSRLDSMFPAIRRTQFSSAAPFLNPFGISGTVPNCELFVNKVA